MGDRVEQPLMASAVDASSAQKLTTNDALTYLKAVKDLFHDSKEKYNEFLEVMRDFKSQRIDTWGVITRVEELFKGNHDLLVGFSTFLPSGYEMKVTEEKKPVEFEEAFNFVNKIKIRFQNDEHTYKSFLGILNMYRMESKSSREVYREVASLFENHDDLFTEFLHFLPDASASRPSTSRHASPVRSVAKRDNWRTMMKTMRHSSMEKMEDGDRNRKRERDDTNSGHERDDDRENKRINRGSPNVRTMMKTMRHSSMEKMEDGDRNRKRGRDDTNSGHERDDDRENKRINRGSPNVRTMMKTMRPPSMEKMENGDRNRKRERDDTNSGHERDDDRENKRINRGSPDVSKDAANHKLSSSSNKEDPNQYKSISELDFSNSERCTPSYRMLPENYRRPAASERTELEASVLNDVWVSVTTGSEDHSFNQAKKNPHEEALFRCEEDRYEMDMLIESVKSTAKKVEDLIEQMKDETKKLASPFRLEDHLTARHMRCIERIYGDHGLDVLELLSKNASVALPITLVRLKQKQEEWSSCRADFNKIWSDTHAENHGR